MLAPEQVLLQPRPEALRSLAVAVQLRNRDWAQASRTSRRQVAGLGAGVVVVGRDSAAKVGACLPCCSPAFEGFAACFVEVVVGSSGLAAYPACAAQEDRKVQKGREGILVRVEDHSPCRSLAEVDREGLEVGSHNQALRQEFRESRADRRDPGSVEAAVVLHKS